MERRDPITWCCGCGEKGKTPGALLQHGEVILMVIFHLQFSTLIFENQKQERAQDTQAEKRKDDTREKKKTVSLTAEGEVICVIIILLFLHSICVTYFKLTQGEADRTVSRVGEWTEQTRNN